MLSISRWITVVGGGGGVGVGGCDRTVAALLSCWWVPVWASTVRSAHAVAGWGCDWVMVVEGLQPHSAADGPQTF